MINPELFYMKIPVNQKLLFHFCYGQSQVKCLRIPTAEPPTTALTGTLGTKGGEFLPFQALRTADCLRTHLPAVSAV
jgi:hypothetical protein